MGKNYLTTAGKEFVNKMRKNYLARSRKAGDPFMVELFLAKVEALEELLSHGKAKETIQKKIKRLK